MKIFLSFIVFTMGTFHSISHLYAGNPQVDVEVGPDDGYYDDDYDDDDVVWVGPGWYYGVWFNTEVDFIAWRRGHGHGNGHHGGHGHGGGHNHGGGSGHYHGGGGGHGHH